MDILRKLEILEVSDPCYYVSYLLLYLVATIKHHLKYLKV